VRNSEAARRRPDRRCAGQDQAIGGRGEGTLRNFFGWAMVQVAVAWEPRLTKRYFYGRRVSLARSAGVGQTSDRVRAAVATEAPVGGSPSDRSGFFQLFSRGCKSLGGGWRGARRIRTRSLRAALARRSAAALCVRTASWRRQPPLCRTTSIRVWQTEEGPATQRGDSIVQTRDGYLWLAPMRLARLTELVQRYLTAARTARLKWAEPCGEPVRGQRLAAVDRHEREI